MHLLFSDRADTHRIWGQLAFGAETARHLRDCVDPGFQVRCVRLLQGGHEVFGYFGPRGDAWRIVRATTDDGISFREARTVFDQPAGSWAHVGTITYSPELDRYLCLKNTQQLGLGFESHAFLSDDGDHWRAVAGNPVYQEGDRWGAMWSRAAQRFVVVQKGFIRVPRKPYSELAMEGQRVATFRTSPDGERWTPDGPALLWKDAVQDERGTWQTLGRPLVPPEHSIAPDDADPPDLEFYAGTPFPYGDRYFLLMLNYAGSFLPRGHAPVQENGHGECVDTEWWLSRDGLNWQRPFRGSNALDGGRAPIRCEPMRIGNELVFHMGDAHFGMPVDRITYVTSRANAVFETVSFPMPATPLLLNAAIAAAGNPRPNQAYVMVELVDQGDRVIPGYEREGCILQAPFDETAHPLGWRSEGGTRSGGELAGTTVRARIIMRASRIYALTAA